MPSFGYQWSKWYEDLNLGFLAVGIAQTIVLPNQYFLVLYPQHIKIINVHTNVIVIYNPFSLHKSKNVQSVYKIDEGKKMAS